MIYASLLLWTVKKYCRGLLEKVNTVSSELICGQDYIFKEQVSPNKKGIVYTPVKEIKLFDKNGGR